MSLIEEGPSKQVRMAHLSIVGSHSVNGVSALHSRLVQTTLVPDFYRLWPERFNNKTNGVTPRRWLVQANPALSDLITRTIGDRWITDLDRLRDLDAMARTTPPSSSEFLAVKRSNKERLARVIAETTGVTVDPRSLFDVQIKRIHEYKRQLLRRHAHRPRLPPPRRGRHSAGRAADVHLRGKGGAGLLGRQADHQIDLQRRLA